MTGPAAVKTEKHMYNGYHSQATPILAEKHDPANWIEQDVFYREEETGMVTGYVCGFQERRHLCDVEDLNR
jgi:hypothetical protein